MLAGKAGRAPWCGASRRTASPPAPSTSPATTRRPTGSTATPRLSQRALREIYLKGFEICVKEGTASTPDDQLQQDQRGVGPLQLRPVHQHSPGASGATSGSVMTDWWDASRAPTRTLRTCGTAPTAFVSQVDVLMPGAVDREGRPAWRENSPILLRWNPTKRAG